MADNNMILWVNVNGQKFDFIQEASIDPSGYPSVKVYNLAPYPIFAVDVYVSTSSVEALEYLMIRNTDDTPKMEIVFDDTISYGIAEGWPGESFSNPISYWRNGLDGKPTEFFPKYSNGTREPLQFINGSDTSLVLKNWNQIINNPLNPSDDVGADGYSKEGYALDHTLNKNKNDYLKITFKRNPLTVIEDLSFYMQDVMIVIQPSQFIKLDDDPLYTERVPQIRDVNIRY